MGWGKKASFNYIKERIWRKLQGWEGKLLSQAGREVLIKAITQAIPTYAMGCFRLPLSLCHEIEAMVKKFFWGQRGDKRKIHWIKWSELTKSKLEGGLGFRDLALFNDSLLAKQAWRLLHDEGTLFYRIFKARFFPNCSFMEAKELATSSYAWKSILKGREVIQMGARFRVGNGKNIKIWQHYWLPIKHPPLVSSPIIESMEDATVDCLIDNNTGKWDAEMLKGVLILAEAELVQRIPLPRCQTEDTLYWPFTADGQYNCKSGYKFLKDLEENSEDGSHSEVDKNLWKNIWSLHVPNKYNNLLWRACRNALPSKQNLFRRTILQYPSCDHCSLQAEDTLHALWSCTGLNEVWDGDRWNFRSRVHFEDFKGLRSWIYENGKPLDLFAIQVWSIWNQRNKLRLNHTCCLTKDLQKMAEESWNEIRRSNLRFSRINLSSTPQTKWTAPTPDSIR